MARNETLFRRYVKRGDVRALGKVFDRTADETLRVAMYFARDPAQAEEWLQETYLTAIERAENWDPTRPFMPWLLGILKNVARRAHAARTQARLPDTPLPAAPESAPVESVEWTAAVAEAVRGLRDPYRAVLILRLEHGLEPAEIAQLQHLPAATIRSQIHRGLLQLRSRLPRERCPEALASLSVPLGLDTIRSNVLSAACATSPAATATAALVGGSLFGGLAVSKFILAGLAAAVLVFAAVDPLGFFENAPMTQDEDRTARSELPEPEAADGQPTQHPDAPALEGRAAQTPEDLATGTLAVGPDVDLDKVDRKRDLHGVVVLRDGRPVPGARVRVEDEPWRSLMTTAGWNRERVELAATTTGPRGTFAVHLQQGARGRLHVEAPGHAARRIQTVSAGERVRVVLDHAVSLEIRVQAPDGTPAPGVPIRVWGAGGPDRATTDSAGIARVEGLDPGGSVMLRPEPQREGWGVPMMLRDVTLPPEGTRELLLELPPGRTIRGVVVDAATAARIHGARVGMGWFMHPRVETDASGAYTLHGWTGQGVRDLAARAPGYVSSVIRLEEGSEELDFALKAGSSMRGRVVDHERAPIPAALVSIVGSVQKDGRQQLSVASARTDAAGSFLLQGLATDMPHSINVRAPGHARRMVDIDPVASGVHDVGDIALSASLRIAGRLLQADGTPGVRFAVRVKGVNEDRAHRRASKQPAHASHYGTYEEVTTDDLGRFTFVDLCPARYTITCRPAGGPPAELTVRLQAGSQAVPVTLRLPGTRTLRIQVLDPDEGPASGGEIVARHKRKRIRAPVDSRGEARIEIPDQVKTLRLLNSGGDDLVDLGRIPIPADSDELVIRQQRAATIRGLVLEPDGKPMAAGHLQGRKAGGPTRTATTNEAGVFEMKCAPGEVLDLVVHGKLVGTGTERRLLPYFGEAKQVRCGARDVRIETVPLDGSEVLRIRVVGPDGAPLEGLTALLEPAQSGNAQQTDADGRAVFEGLSSAERVVRVFGGPRARGTAPWSMTVVKATPGGPIVAVDMQRAVMITGRLLRPDGTPAPSVVVNAASPDDPAVGLGGGFTNKDGRFGLYVPGSTREVRLTGAKVIDGVELELDRVLEALPREPLELQMTRKQP